MDISRELAIKILKYLERHNELNFPFVIVNREYSDEDQDFVEIEPSEWRSIERDKKYQTFQLWENLQNLEKQTLKLMLKGFLERITNESLELHVARLAKNYRKAWKRELWECGKSEEYGLNEFICGKADAYEDCLDLIKEYRKGE